MADEKRVAIVVEPPQIGEWSKEIAKVRITPGGGRSSAVFKGKTYTHDSEPVAPGSLGWSPEEIGKATMEGKLVIEKFDKDGNELKASGEPARKLSHGAPKRERPASPANEEDDKQSVKKK